MKNENVLIALRRIDTIKKSFIFKRYLYDVFFDDEIAVLKLYIESTSFANAITKVYRQLHENDCDHIIARYLITKGVNKIYKYFVQKTINNDDLPVIQPLYRNLDKTTWDPKFSKGAVISIQQIMSSTASPNTANIFGGDLKLIIYGNFKMWQHVAPLTWISRAEQEWLWTKFDGNVTQIIQDEDCTTVILDLKQQK